MAFIDLSDATDLVLADPPYRADVRAGKRTLLSKMRDHGYSFIYNGDWIACISRNERRIWSDGCRASGEKWINQNRKSFDESAQAGMARPLPSFLLSTRCMMEEISGIELPHHAEATKGSQGCLWGLFAMLGRLEESGGSMEIVDLFCGSGGIPYGAHVVSLIGKPAEDFAQVWMEKVATAACPWLPPFKQSVRSHHHGPVDFYAERNGDGFDICLEVSGAQTADAIYGSCIEKFSKIAHLRFPGSRGKIPGGPHFCSFADAGRYDSLVGCRRPMISRAFPAPS